MLSTMNVLVGHPENAKMCETFHMTDTMGHRLRELRKQRHLNQVDVAAAIDIDRGYLSRVENDEKNASLEIISSLADFYNVTIDYLYKGSSTPLSGPKMNCDGPHTDEEMALIELWREMDDGQRNVFISMMSGLLKAKVA